MPAAARQWNILLQRFFGTLTRGGSLPDDLQRLQLAFAYHMIEQVIGSDAELDAEELTYLAEVFPPDLLIRLEFLDGAGARTAAFDEARDLALVELPERLTLGEKLALVELLVGAAASDGVLTAQEVDALSAAARMLAVPDVAWEGHLDALLSAGGIRRAE
jgi:hypothetical protein